MISSSTTAFSPPAFIRSCVVVSAALVKASRGALFKGEWEMTRRFAGSGPKHSQKVKRVEPWELSAPQQELLTAMKNGTYVHYMSGMSPYFFRNDTMRHCTKTIEALIKRGLVEECNRDWRGFSLRTKKQT